MKSRRMLALLLSFSVMVSAGLMGCGKQKDNQTNANLNEKKVVLDKDQYLNLVLDEPKTLDIARTGDVYCGQVVTEFSEGLTRLEQDENGKDVVKPAGAKSWEHNDKGTVWKFHLRDYEWSDGKKVTAKDFEYSMKRILDPKTASSIAYLLSPIKNADEYNSNKVSRDSVGVKALDDKTLQITLKEPCPYFLNLTYYKAMYPQREDIVKKYGEKFGSEPDTMVFSGPFKVTKWTHNHEIVLEKNDKYWDRNSVKLNKLNFKIIKDSTAQFNTFYSGSIDTFPVGDGKLIDKCRKSGKFDELNLAVPTTEFSCFNQKNKIFSNKNVRRAFSMALNREDITKTIFQGDKPAYAWIPKSIDLGKKSFREQSGEEPVKILKKDFKAKELLKKGLKELNMNPDPSKVTITFLQHGTEQWYRDFAEYVQQMYKKQLGVNVKAEYVNWPVFMDRIDNGQYDIATMNWTSDYNDPSAMFDIYLSSSNIMPTFWKSKKYDEIVNKARVTLDEKERLKYYKEAEKILLYDESVIMPIVYRKGNNFTYKYVKSIMSPLFGYSEYKYAYTVGREK
ncbi:peptide ABC transporter substrate-binding protein [Haloimpatiens sp. FM7330]|uniref:peptide ABC transporter substrate-binding protein n=1 Tax=Haloimpatiens sp. FM7330 TaxID=3298610 RepID=UPI003634D6D5